MTVHETAAQRAARNWLRTPERANLLHLFVKGVEEIWDHEWLDVFGQHYQHTRFTWPVEQVYCFGRLHVGVGDGSIGFMRLRAGGVPQEDKRRAENAGLLADLPEPFRAKVDQTQHCGDSDGLLAWDRPIEVEVSVPGKPNTFRVVEPGSLPLEIGTTQPSRTIQHLGEDRGVARWPYGSEFIWLLINEKRLSPEGVAVPDLVLATHY